MANPIKIRASYASDSNFLSRLKIAVEKDDRISRDVKMAILSSTDSLILALLRGDAQVRVYKAVKLQKEQQAASEQGASEDG